MLLKMHRSLIGLVGSAILVLWSSHDGMVTGANLVSNSNLFIDTVLHNRMPNFARYESLDPATVGPFQVVTSIKNWAGHKFKANFTVNSVSGLSNGVSRLNDCAPVGMHAGNITVGCNVHFGGVRITLDGFGQGDSTIKKMHRVTASATLGNSYALVEAAGPHPHKPGSLVRFALGRMNVTVTLGDNIALSNDREMEFSINLKSELTLRLDGLLKTKYVEILAKAINSVNLPPVN